MITLKLPFEEKAIQSVRAGDEVILEGKLLVGRDQVHKKLYEAIMREEQLPVDISRQAVYYMGPSPAPEGCIIGSCGPTTSARMDPYSPLLMEHGLRVMIGKGPRSREVAEAVKKYRGLYLQAYGGCGALYASCVTSSRLIAYPELGPEALLELQVHDFPAVCLIDCLPD